MNIEEILIKNKDITELSNFKTKATSKYYFELNNRQDVDIVIEIYRFGISNKLKILFIGGGTNLLFAFEKFEGIIIRNCLKGWKYDKITKILDANSGDFVSDISESLYNNYGQTLWKRFIGLPGSIGGAVFGNAGCFGLEMENNFQEAMVLDLSSGKILNFNKKKMEFEYRNSIVKKTNNYFIISVKFDLGKLVEKYSSTVDNIHFREVKQPKGNTCGSFFKNHSRELSAGALIEKVGLKGKKIGGAFFSNKHANFLMSDGNATYKELLELIKKAQEKVNKEFNIDLIPEVRIITN